MRDLGYKCITLVQKEIDVGVELRDALVLYLVLVFELLAQVSDLLAAGVVLV